MLQKEVKKAKIYARIRLGVFCAGILALFFSTQVFAKVDAGTLRFFTTNNILYYDNCSGSSGTNLYGDVTVCGDTIEEKIWSGLRSFLTPEQAAGAMGNMAHEGGFSPARHESSFLNDSAYSDFDLFGNESVSYGIGLIQWSFGRRTRLMEKIKTTDESLVKYLDQDRQTYGNLNGTKFLEAAGDEVTNKLLQIELSYLKEELTNNASYSGFLETTTVAEASEYFLRYVESPAGVEGQVASRQRDSEDYYNTLKDFSCSGSSSASSSSSSGSTISGSSSDNNIINQTALNLAWDTDGHTGLNDAKPEYKTALEQVGFASSGDQEVSSGRSCDVFVATVMRYSGYDPEFYCCMANDVGSYMASHPEKYELVTPTGGGGYQESDLQPGDILSSPRHVALYVKLSDGTGRVASASHGDRMPDTTRTWDLDNGYHAYPAVYRPKNIPSSNGNNSGNTCNNVQNNVNGLVSGGMTEEQAQAFIQSYAERASLHETGNFYFQDAYIVDAGCMNGTMNNCVAFSQWFLNKYTTLGPDWANTVNGNNMVSHLGETKGLLTGSVPKAYAIYSVGAFNHTGVVLGVDTDAQTLVIGEASCNGKYSPRARSVSFSEAEGYGYTYAYTDNILTMK